MPLPSHSRRTHAPPGLPRSAAILKGLPTRRSKKLRKGTLPNSRPVRFLRGVDLVQDDQREHGVRRDSDVVGGEPGVELSMGKTKCQS